MAEEETIVEEEAPVEEPVEAEVSEEAEGEEQSSTLLSGDGGEGEGVDTGVPEEYLFTPPDGMDVDETQIEAFGEYAHGLGLSQEQFQKLIEFDIQRGQNAQESMATAYADRISGWADATKADKELGGEALNENLGVAKQAMDAFASPELAKLIEAPSAENPDGLGLGNHPEVIRLFYRVGKAISESSLITGDSKVEGSNSLQKMYPTMFNHAE